MFTSLDEIQSVAVRGAARIQKTLRENEALIRKYHQITVIKCDVPMEVSERDFILSPKPPEL